MERRFFFLKVIKQIVKDYQEYGVVAVLESYGGDMVDLLLSSSGYEIFMLFSVSLLLVVLLMLILEPVPCIDYVFERILDDKYHL